MNRRHPESRTPRAKARRHQPDWETNELLDGAANERDTTRQTGRQMKCYKAGSKRTGDMWRAKQYHPNWETNELLDGETNEFETSGEPGPHQPDSETNELLQGETNEWETVGEPDTTSQTGKQMKCHRGNGMGDTGVGGHHQPDWETNATK